MKILLGHKGNVDFDGPISITKSQKDQFINFLETIFDPVKEIEYDNFRTERLGDKYFIRRWDIDEIAILIDFNITLEEACELLGRTFMSVNIKRGEFIPDFMRWANKKGHNLIQDDIKEIIKEYLEETKKIAKQKRTKESQLEKEIDEIDVKIDKLDQRIESTKLVIRVGLLGLDSEEKIIKTEEEIMKLEDERSKKYAELYKDVEIIIEEEEEIEEI